MNKKKMMTLIVILMVFLLMIIPISSAQQYSISYVYRLGDNGIASVTIIISGLIGVIEYSIQVYEKVVNESLVAFDEQGNIVLAVYNGTHITIYPINTTDKVIIQYEAIVGHVTVEGLVQVNLTIQGPTTIVLPKGAGLIYFSDNPEVEVVGETIKLRYSEPGIILLEYIPPIPTTTSSPPTTLPKVTPTSTQVSTIEAIPTSTPSPTTLPSPAPITSSTSPTVPATTPTTTVQPSPTFPTIVIVFIIVIIVLLVGGIILYKTKLSKTYFSTSSSKYFPPSASSREVEFLEHRKLDERDKLILSKLSEKPMSISELARELGLSKSTVWRRVRKLEKQGYVKTREEGKKTIIELTEKAKSL